MLWPPVPWAKQREWGVEWDLPHLALVSAGTSSIDTTCTIWGLETGQVLGRVNLVSGHVKTQLIAHDKEVMMVSFPPLQALPVPAGERSSCSLTVLKVM